MVENILIGIGMALIASPIGVSLKWPLPATCMLSVGLTVIGILIIS